MAPRRLKMRYRIYFKHEDTGEENVREVEADGMAYRICDDHGNVVFGEPWPKGPGPFVNPLQTREPLPYKDD